MYFNSTTSIVFTSDVRRGCVGIYVRDIGVCVQQ